MNNKTASYFVFALLVLIGIGAAVTLVPTPGTGSLFVVTSSSSEQPTPVESYDSASAGYQPITVNGTSTSLDIPMK